MLYVLGVSSLKDGTMRVEVKDPGKKVDGSMREAFGTLALNLIPAESVGADRKRNDTVQTYWDTEKGAWRCFKKANLIRI